MASPYINIVRSQADMEALLSEKAVVVIGFHAPWSAPCRKMAQVYSRLAAKHRSLTFVKVEIAEDNIQSVAQKCRLIALPTFIILKAKEEVGRIRGADQKGLEDMIAKCASETGTTDRDAEFATGDVSLLEYLDMRKVNCLNEAQDHPLKSIVEMRTRNTSETYLESDADEQLLITLPFNQEVKVRSVLLHTKDPKFGPKKIKIVINKLALGFGDVESATEPAVAQVLEVPVEVVKEAKPIHLRFVRLQKVNSLHIFIESNQGNEDITRIDTIDVYGPSHTEPPATTQMTGLRDFWGTYRRGLDLLQLFQRNGRHENLSTGVALVRESALLCPAEHVQRALLVGTLATALTQLFEYQGDYADLNEAIAVFYDVLGLYPPGHPERATVLSNLSGALLHRYQFKGDISDLEEAIKYERQALNLHPPSHPGRAALLSNLSTALCLRYEREGNRSDLDEAIEKQREALIACSPGHPNRAAYLSNLANALGTRHTREGSLSDLEEAVELKRQALNLHFPGHPNHAASLANLATALLARYEREGGRSDLDEAIKLKRQALKLRFPGHSNHAASPASLATALLARYEREGGRSDLEEAIGQQRKALNLRHLGHPDRASSLNGLSNSLRIRYESEGNLSDLEEAIEKQREALNLYLPGSPYRCGSLSNLALALQMRYEREGGRSDLEEAIEQQREACELCPPGQPDRALSLNNLGNALFARYKREGSLSDLAETIELQREVLDLHLPGHPKHASSHNNLAAALLIRYKCEGSRLDLEESIRLQRQALNLHSPGHPNRAASLANLATALLARYEREGGRSDLEEAIGQQQDVLKLRLSGHPDRASSLYGLSNSLRIRYDRDGSIWDLQEAIEKQREALSLQLPGDHNRSESLRNLANALLTRYEREGGRSDLEEAIKQQQEALNLRHPGDPGRASYLYGLSTTLLRRYECGGNISDLEDAIEQQRRALSLLSADHPDQAGSSNNLATALITRYECVGSRSDLEEAIEKLRDALSLGSLGRPGRAPFFSNLSNILLTRYKCDGSLSDLQEATELREKALALYPHGHPNRSEALFSLSRAYMLTIDGKIGASTVHDHRALVDKVFVMLREAVYHTNSPPLHRWKAALLWISACRSPVPQSALNAYSAALDQLDIVLATSSTLASKHAQLSSPSFVRCDRLGVEAASCAVREGDMTRAVEFLERGRNLLFAQIGKYRIDLEELQKKNAELAKRFSDLSSRLDSSVVSNQPTLEGRTIFEDPNGRYRRVTSDWEGVVNDIRALPGFEDFLRPLRYAALQAASAAGPVVVVIPDSDQSHALIILQSHDTPHYVRLPKAGKDDLVELCNGFTKAVRSDNANKLIKTLLLSLWELVVGPIAEALEKELGYPLGSRVWWCPSSVLSFLPLHAAGHYTSNRQDQNFPAKYVSSYTSTLLALVRAQSKGSISKGGKMLVVAQPDTPGQGPLPNTIPEAEAVKTLAEAKLKMSTTLLSSKEGTHTAVLGGIVNHSWIHLTCHGNQRVNPFASCFHLYDKDLTLHNIVQRGLPDAKFAFLAACHTATGDSKLLDEGLHLAAGLQFAGFQSVVGTIWEVADIDGPVIAKAFYEALREEQVGEEGVDCRGAARALSKAVKALRDNGVPLNRWIRHIHIGI